MLEMIALGIAFASIVYLLTPRLGKKLKELGIKGKDVHKPHKPEIPEMGGIVFIPFLIILSLLFWQVFTDINFLLIGFSVSIFFLYGVIDDLRTLGKWIKLGLSISIAFLIAGIYSFINGNFTFALFMAFSFLSVIIGNSINVLAGFNGLESGSAVIVLLTTSFYLFVKGLQNYSLLAFLFAMIVFSFFLHNKYPAKIFPGDSGTLGLGGALVGFAVYLNLYPLLLPILSLHFSDAILKAITAGYFSSSEKPKSKVSRNGILIPGSGYLSIPKLYMKSFEVTERRLVKYLLFTEIIIAILVLVVML